MAPEMSVLKSENNAASDNGESDKLLKHILNKNSQYASWCTENEAPLEEAEIALVFEEIGSKFGFQKDNIANMLDFFMCQLDSRSSRMSCQKALLSLHADYIGGHHSNYRKWYFATQYNIQKKKNRKSFKDGQRFDISSSEAAELCWKTYLSELTEKDYVIQICLYLLIWGEANNIRFMPECICFLYYCAFEWYYSLDKSNESMNAHDKPYSYLDNVITPLYNYIATQSRRADQEKDHSNIIGYDDINQLFWYAEGLNRIKLNTTSRLMDFPKEGRWNMLKEVQWEKTFIKTYRERRSWLHAITNYSRIWVIHASMYWYFTSFNSPTLYTKNYIQLLNNQPPAQVAWSIIALGGALACMLQLFATICDCILFNSCIINQGNWVRFISVKLIVLTALLSINVTPSIYILAFIPLDVFSKSGYILSIAQFAVSVATVLYLAVIPSSSSFGSTRDFNYLTFTGSFPNLNFNSRVYSLILWICIFSAKFVESYFFLTLSLNDPIRILSIMEMKRCYGTEYFGSFICEQQGRMVLILILLADLVLFFLDTYLWYIICNCMFSIGLSLSQGVSVFSPWKNIFIRLPERISSKIIFGEGNGDTRNDLLSNIWNGIILSMYREHLLSIDQVNKLVYQKVNDGKDSYFVRTPLFFVYQDDSSNKMLMNDFFNVNHESGRRISYFAQSISSLMPEPIPTVAMPTFTVLVPHYSEKIILSLKEIIKEGANSKVSLLEYLKQLNPIDWENFVTDTKILASIDSIQDELLPLDYGLDVASYPTSTASQVDLSKQHLKSSVDDLPLYCYGFKNASFENTLRTRIWASLRTQTLYRTVSGFSNYRKAIKLLHFSESNRRYTVFDQAESEVELDLLVDRKFKLVVAMQEYQHFTNEEINDAHILFAKYPNMLVSYLETIKSDDGSISYYSNLLDVSNFDGSNNYEVKYRIKLSGNPILGDGKADNQNSSLIFYRGEYIQVIDSNQDNYLEECLKIKSVLAEFDEYDLEDYSTTQYLPGIGYDLGFQPVGILGAREYIFSENMGVLGDIAASKEQTFGTLFARTLAEIGGKLHYGHPDFLNGIFMTTRGGLSKGQKGLHLNEDIYAGMTCISRGGRIKHCDYFQCGKGRDLGFGTILNFTTKIGAGMGEQILSREHYNLGTQLPIDRFLTFFYAHPGFHLNNLFIMLSVELFMLILVNFGALIQESIICGEQVLFTDLEQPLGCYNLRPILDWINRYAFSVLICFFLSFLPLLFQELIEKGFNKSVKRIALHLFSLSPVFEVFVCQIYAKSLRDNLTFGGATYIATGRGVAIPRISFTLLYARYASISIYSGSIFFLKVLFGTITAWQPSLLWFWLTTVSLCVAPFLFNPHQFSWNEFFLDYREFLRWLSRGNNSFHRNSWIQHVRGTRTKFTGYKKRTKTGAQKELSKSKNRASRWNVFVDQCFIPLLNSTLLIIPYLFINSQNGVQNPKRVNVLLRLLILVIFPFILNGLSILVLFTLSFVFGTLLSYCRFLTFPGLVAVLAHSMLIFISLLNFLILLYLHSGSLPRVLCGVICVLSLQRAIILTVSTIILSRELDDDVVNRVWWSGKYFSSGMGFLLTMSQLIREFPVKIIEMQVFSFDFILGHLILFAMSPILFLPFIDKLHTLILFWCFNLPSPKKILTKKKNLKLKRLVLGYSFLFFSSMLIFAAIIVCSILVSVQFETVMQYLPPVDNSILDSLIQPNFQNNNDTGENAPDFILRSKPEVVPMKTIL